ncbi:hypothetical protein D0Y65_042647 [Glycine soja]|uniref:CREG-like beta-barrel domain-containing protein n=3 Tax=Glycine subgen. Soja TaxID=1462606 RepID=A0A445GE57_GLYSO|nr:hypothetical protein D0Y65_042647 [Glycine soja]
MSTCVVCWTWVGIFSFQESLVYTQHNTNMKSMVTPLTRVLPFRHPNGYNTLPFSLTRYPSSPNFSFSFSPLTLTLSMAASPQSSAPTVSPGDANINKDGVFQLIQAHQEKAARLPPVEEIRTVLDRSVRGMLSTFSKKFDGYPSGSMVDFACDSNGYPILAVSDLAVHSKDLTANPKCSLLVARDPEDRTDLVITVHGDAISVPENEREAVRAAYLARHPNAFWVDFGDFRFLRIEPKVVRFVSGVATALLGSGEFSGDEYKSAKVDPIAQFSKPVASHMNKDHAEDNKVIVQHWTSVPAGYQGDTFKLRVPFPRRAEDRKDVKTLIVEMLQAARPKVD